MARQLSSTSEGNSGYMMEECSAPQVDWGPVDAVTTHLTQLNRSLIQEQETCSCLEELVRQEESDTLELEADLQRLRCSSQSRAERRPHLSTTQANLQSSLELMRERILDGEQENHLLEQEVEALTTRLDQVRHLHLTRLHHIKARYGARVVERGPLQAQTRLGHLRQQVALLTSRITVQHKAAPLQEWREVQQEVVRLARGLTLLHQQQRLHNTVSQLLQMGVQSSREGAAADTPQQQQQCVPITTSFDPLPEQMKIKANRSGELHIRRCPSLVMADVDGQAPLEGPPPGRTRQDTQQHLAPGRTGQDTQQHLAPGRTRQDTQQHLAPGRTRQDTQQHLAPGRTGQDTQQHLAPGRTRQDTQQHLAPGRTGQDTQQCLPQVLTNSLQQGTLRDLIPFTADWQRQKIQHSPTPATADWQRQDTQERLSPAAAGQERLPTPPGKQMFSSNLSLLKLQFPKYGERKRTCRWVSETCGSNSSGGVPATMSYQPSPVSVNQPQSAPTSLTSHTLSTSSLNTDINHSQDLERRHSDSVALTTCHTHGTEVVGSGECSSQAVGAADGLSVSTSCTPPPPPHLQGSAPTTPEIEVEVGPGGVASKRARRSLGSSLVPSPEIMFQRPPPPLKLSYKMETHQQQTATSAADTKLPHQQQTATSATDTKLPHQQQTATSAADTKLTHHQQTATSAADTKLPHQQPITSYGSSGDLPVSQGLEPAPALASPSAHGLPATASPLAYGPPAEALPPSHGPPAVAWSSAHGQPAVAWSSAHGQPAVAWPLAHGQPAVVSPSAHGQPAVAWSSAHGQPVVVSSLAHGQPAVASPSAHSQPAVASPSAHSQPAVASPSSHGQPVVASPSAHGQPAVASPSGYIHLPDSSLVEENVLSSSQGFSLVEDPGSHNTALQLVEVSELSPSVMLEPGAAVVSCPAPPVSREAGPSPYFRATPTCPVPAPPVSREAGPSPYFLASPSPTSPPHKGLSKVMLVQDEPAGEPGFFSSPFPSGPSSHTPGQSVHTSCDPVYTSGPSSHTPGQSVHTSYDPVYKLGPVLPSTSRGAGASPPPHDSCTFTMAHNPDDISMEGGALSLFLSPDTRRPLDEPGEVSFSLFGEPSSPPGAGAEPGAGASFFNQGFASDTSDADTCSYFSSLFGSPPDTPPSSQDGAAFKLF